MLPLGAFSFQDTGKMIKNIVACTKRGAYASIAIIVSPLGAFFYLEGRRPRRPSTRRN